jgi:hypothetical protein
MNVSFVSILSRGACGVAACLALSVVAQCQQSSQPDAISREDRAIAGALYHLFVEEVAVSRFAAPKISEPKTKEFADAIAQDYQNFLDKLNQVAPLPETSQQGQSSNASMPNDSVRMHVEMAQYHAQRLQQYLDRYHGARFAHAYLNHEVDGQLRTAVQLHILQKYSSPKLRPLLDQGLAMAEKSFEKATQIMDQLHGAGTTAHTTQQR